MGKHFLSMQDLDDRLKALKGSEIEVEKKEQQDLDIVHIALDDVRYDKDFHKFDEYESEYTLELHGVGTIETDVGNAVPLPSPVYEIALDVDTMREYEENDNELIISTERAAYKIRKV